MNIQAFLDHWQIAENPFRAEEARHDPVFSRSHDARHPDFDKILGDLSRPSTAIVFGEKGAGKTAIRLQIAEVLDAHNTRAPDARVLLIPYDDLNPMLDRLASRLSVGPADGGKEVLGALSKVRLADHLDAILHTAVPPLVDRLLSSADDAQVVKRAGDRIRRDAVLLAAVYDREADARDRLSRLRRRVGAPADRDWLWWMALLCLGWLPAAAVFALSLWVDRATVSSATWFWIFLGALGLWGLVALKVLLLDRWRARRLGRRLARHLRSLPRSAESLAASAAVLPGADRLATASLVADADEPRYDMVARLRRVAATLGYRGLMIVLDRLDEPTMIGGDPDRMRAVVWPMLNNKFLQQEGVAVKLLLPIELRHALFRESQAFFQDARLDKQNMVERLAWTGATLYDLCAARLRACRPDAAQPLALADLFEPDVTRQELIDSLDQMHQPRDAFKLLYHCMQEHCSNVTDDQAASGSHWRIPRHVLQSVRKQQVERVQMLSRGLRPA
ncbi:MAG: hypothetical protein IBJ11_02270 [Phycisphaerales bacterium]|nr:hypothetical protein [Phycisphaerales bacterium]